MPSKYKEYVLDKHKRTKNQHNAVNEGESNEVTEANAMMSNYDIKDFCDDNYVRSMNNVLAQREPLCFKEAIQDENWKKAMEEELQAFEWNTTWKFCELPPR